MEAESHLEYCSLCLRYIAEQRHIKGNVCLKYSGSSASEVVAYIVGQEVQILSVCFRCYRLLLGIDYHQYEFKRLKDSIVKIYYERSIEMSCSDVNKAKSSSPKIIGAEEPLSCGTEVESSVQSSFTIDGLRVDAKEVDKEYSVKTEESRDEREENIKETGRENEENKKGGWIGECEVKEDNNAPHVPTEDSGIMKFDNVSIRSSKRNKKERKLHDFEYYDDVSKETTQTLETKVAGAYAEICALVNENGDNKNVCPICSKDFALKKDYLNHSCMRGVGKNISFKCKGCHMSFSIRHHYIKHIDSCYKNIPVKCHICLTVLQSAAYLPRHLEAFHNGSAVTQKSSLCDLCGRTFSRKEALQRHQAKVHRVSYGTHQCAKCGQTFLHTSLLMEHIRAHRGYPCSDCNKIFSCKSNLKVHKQTYHQNKTLYVCSTCNKRWRFHASYTNHMRKVHGEAQFKCPRCKVLFSAENAFERHKEACAGVHRRPVLNKNLQRSNSVKGKKNSLSNHGEGSGNCAYENKTKIPTITPKDSMTNYHTNHPKNYLRLKKIVRMGSSSVKHQIALPSKDVICIGKNSNARELDDRNYHDSYTAVSTQKVLMPLVTSENDNMNSDTRVKTSTEIVVETLEDFSSECQLVILVEDGSDDKT